MAKALGILMLVLKIFGLVIVFFAGLRWFEYRQTFQPSKRRVSEPKNVSSETREIQFLSNSRFSISAWFIPCLKQAAYAEWLVIFSHGNAGNISHRQDLYRTWRALGFNLLAYDYRGYGSSEGRPTEDGTYQDLQAAIAWAKGQGFDESRILLLGKSLGGGVSSQVAVHQKVAGLILHSTFTSLPDLAKELFPWLPVKSLAKMQFNTRSHLEHVTAPVMIIHSREDQLIGFQHAAANKAACPQACHLLEIGGDHNDLESPRAFALKEGLDTFMKQVTSHLDQHPPTPSQP